MQGQTEKAGRGTIKRYKKEFKPMSNPEGWKIALERIAAEKEAKTGFLDLGRLGLTEPPESLFELEHLEQLNLGKYFFDSGGNYQISQSDIKTNTIGSAFAKLKNLPNGPKPRKNLSSRYKCFLGPPQQSNNIKVRSFKKWPRLELEWRTKAGLSQHNS